MTIKVYNNGWDKVADGGVSPDVQPIRQTINITTLSVTEPDIGNPAALKVGQTITGETSNVTAEIESWDPEAKTLTLINCSGTFMLPEKITNDIGYGSWTTAPTTEITAFLGTKLFSFVLLKAEFSSPCWFTLYTDAAARDADTRTDQYQDPLNSSGVLAEFITSSTDGTTSPYLNLCTPAPICIGDGTYILETTGVQYQRTSWSYPVIPGTDTNTLQPDDRYYMMKNSPQESFWVWDGQIIKNMSAGGDFTSPIIDGYMYVANIGIGGMVDSGTYDNPYTGGTDFSWNTWGISKQDVNTVGRTNLTWKARNHLGGAWTQNDIALTVVPMKDQGLANYDPIRAI